MRAGNESKNPPDPLAELLQRRQARRRQLAKLSFEEKIEMVERLRELQDNRRRLQDSLAAKASDGEEKDSHST